MFKYNRYFWFFLGCYLLYFLAFNNKTFLIPFFICGLCLYFIFKLSLPTTIFLLLTFTLPFETNLRQWSLTVGSGYYFYFGITLKLILGLCLFFLSLPRLTRFPSSPNSLSLAFFFLLSCLATFLLKPLQTASFIGLLQLWSSVIIFYLGSNQLRSSTTRKILVSQLMALTVFLVSVSFLQLINQHPLGLIVEQNPNFTYYTTDGPSQFRASSIMSHPVYFGSFLSMLIPLILYFALTSTNSFFVVLLVLVLAAALSTLSRSVWLNLALIGFFFRRPLISFRHRFSFKTPLLLLSLPLLLYIGFQTFRRFQSLPNLFQDYNSGTARLELLTLSFQIIKDFPLTGIGLNRFSTFKTFERPDLSPPSFLVEAHNTWLIFLTELGIPAGILFILFCYQTMRRSYSSSSLSLSKAVWVGCLCFLLSCQFHPLFNQDPSFNLFMLLAAFLTSGSLPRPDLPKSPKKLSSRI